MAIRFYSKMGKMTIEQNNRKFKIDIYNGNCLAVFINEYKNAKGDIMKDLYLFLDDEKHCKRIIKSNGGKLIADKVVKIELNVADPDAMKLARILTNNGYKVTIYRKEKKL